MRIKFLSYLFFTVIFQQSVNAQFADDFSDGDFTANPTWSGTSADFIVNTSQQLQLNQTIASASYLSAPNASATLDGMEWNVWVKQTFSPSGSNFGRVYLVSDQADVSQPLNGYYLQFGEAGSLDAIELFQQTGIASTSVCRATNGMIANSFTVRVRVVRDNTGLWELYVDYSGGTNYILENSGTEITYNTTSFIGVQCVYTASNADNFFYDDFYFGPEIIDVAPPTLVSATAISTTQLDVVFSETVDQVSAETEGNYFVNNGIGTPANAVRDATNLSLVHLTFTNAFSNGVTNELMVNAVQDMNTNAINLDTIQFMYFVPAIPQYRDVVINEIFADPGPQVSLPDAEFIELYNASNQVFDLQGWTFTDGSSTATMGSHVLAPGAFVIVCPNADTASFQFYGNVIGVSSFPSLNNAGDDIRILDDNGNLIDRVIYSDDWYQDEVKKDGGWTLEQVNPNAACSNGFNWRASNGNTGGTPDAINSVYNNTPDTQAPSVSAVYVNSNSQLQVVFNEVLDSMNVLTATYTVSGGISVTGVQNVSPAYTNVILTLSPVLDTGVVYTLTISNITDCEGNTITANTNVDFVLPYQAISNEIIINEILFNPATSGVDFVEIYNHSEKPVSLKNWTLANYDNDTIYSHKIITLNDFVLYPDEYLLLTTEKQTVLNEYPLSLPYADRFLEMESLPSFNNDSGTVYLINNQNKVSDKFSYTEDMQFELLNSVEGVSLERLDFNRATNDAGNWHSAAEAVGFATPGYLNSQFHLSDAGDGNISIEPETFSPDNDGYNDVVNIHFAFDEPGFVANVHLYDVQGRLIKELARNELLGTKGTFTWDGINEKREKALTGIYVLYFEVFDLSGQVKKYKKSLVLATKF